VVSVAALPCCKAGYVLRSAWYQAELLGSRVPIEKLRKSGRLAPPQLAKLDLIQDVKAFGAEIGLSATRNYESVAVGFDRRLHNVSACPPLAFDPKTWWFPIVGRVPYLGYFSEADARASADKLAREGLDVYVSRVGAYSTLGWFRDPILPSMLEWDERSLAETILHELAHATLWVKGSVAFNESFAGFVGEEASFRYLQARHGPESAEYLAARRQLEDDERWAGVQHALVRDLEALYDRKDLGAEGKRERKQELLLGLPSRVDAAGFHDSGRFRREAEKGVWNNARLMHFRTYHSDRPAFERLLAAEGGDLLKFIARIQQIAAKGEPFAELRRATSP
jgi:predicted aminopeptidase